MNGLGVDPATQVQVQVTPGTPPTRMLPFIAIIPLTTLGLIALSLVIYTIYIYCPTLQDELGLLKARILGRIPKTPDIIITSPSYPFQTPIGVPVTLTEKRSWKSWIELRRKDLWDYFLARLTCPYFRLTGRSIALPSGHDRVSSPISIYLAFILGLTPFDFKLSSGLALSLAESNSGALSDGVAHHLYPEGLPCTMTYGQVRIFSNENVVYLHLLI